MPGTWTASTAVLFGSRATKVSSQPDCTVRRPARDAPESTAAGARRVAPESPQAATHARLPNAVEARRSLIAIDLTAGVARRFPAGLRPVERADRNHLRLRAQRRRLAVPADLHRGRRAGGARRRPHLRPH